jgi:uncharacterized membrane protein (UPF0127 family)
MSRSRTDFLRHSWRPLLGGLLFLALGAAHAQMGPLEDLDAFPRAKLEIGVSRKAPLSFDVWLADTPARQAQGLMFVRSLPEQRGMLFVYQSPKTITMWMKNTYIPLDMVFIDDRGRIQSIVEKATPHSLATISSGKPALAILEIGGGEAKRLGLKPGQHVSHPALPKH